MLTGLLYAMKGEIESLLPEGAEPEKTVAGVPFYRIRENVVACCGGVGHAPVYLHGVHGHHLAAEALRQRHTHLRLAAGRGPHHADDLVVHVLTSIRFGKRRSAVMACKVVDFSFCR